MSITQPYTGSGPKLCLAFDVGTTFSGVSYCILSPGQVPYIYSVTRYLGQNHTGIGPKVPSIIYYDQDGNLRAVGAEASSPTVVRQAKEESWTKVAWFKLLFTPKTAASKDIRRHKTRIGPLPRGKSECDVLADYMRYLYECTKQWIHTSHSNGTLLWNSVETDISFVLSHPNMWGGVQQRKMKSAMILAGLIPDTGEGREKVMFVSEGEACLHYCMNKQGWDSLEVGEGVIIIDAGGGTVDVSAYDMLNWSPVSFEELNVSESILQGSQFVTFRMESFLQDKFKDPTIHSKISDLCVEFDESVKPVFKHDTDTYCITHNSDQSVELSGSEIASLFEPTITSVIDVIKKQRQGFPLKIKTAFLLGGFAASPWLFEKLAAKLRPMHMRLFRPDLLLNRAVAEGAVSFYLDNRVHYRIARFTYGVKCTREFEHNHPEHQRRKFSVIVNPSGTAVLPGGFKTVLKKGTKIAGDREFSWVFLQESRGNAADPQWVDTEPGQFKQLCAIHADVSRVPKVVRQTSSIYAPGGGSRYFQQRFWVVLSLGMTELKAQIIWYENSEEKRSPAQIVYDEDID